MLKPLVITCDFNSLSSKKCSPLAYNSMKKGKSSLVLFKNFYKKKIQNTYFPEHFMLTAFAKRKENREGELKCLLHTPLISNAFLIKVRIKGNSTL